MSNHFLVNFMYAAKTITKAQRGMAVDADLQLLDTINLSQDIINSNLFQEVASNNLNRALQKGEAIITNNMITDPSQAPVTNTNFADLRVVIIIPVDGYGAVYLDQPLRYGIIARSVIDKLVRLAMFILENQLEDGSPEQIEAWYGELE